MTVPPNRAQLPPDSRYTARLAASVPAALIEKLRVADFCGVKAGVAVTA